MQSEMSVPSRLTDFGIQHFCETGNPTANSLDMLKVGLPLSQSPETLQTSRDALILDFVTLSNVDQMVAWMRPGQAGGLVFPTEQES